MSVDSAADVGVHAPRLPTGRARPPRPDQSAGAHRGRGPHWYPDSLATGVSTDAAASGAPPQRQGSDDGLTGSDDRLPGRHTARDEAGWSDLEDPEPVPGEAAGPESAGGTGTPPNAPVEFREFFERHHRELSRFAYLLTGDHDAADDLTAEALTAAWSKWERVSSADSPLAYVRRIVANLATSRLRRVIRERRGMTVLGMLAERTEHAPDDADVPAAVDLRAALMTLPARKRACVVLRYAFDLSEADTARTLGISVGTVKSQTSKAVAELERVLGTRPELTHSDPPDGTPARKPDARPLAPQAPRRAGATRGRRRAAGGTDPASVARSALNRLRDSEAPGRLRGSEG
ncbi:MULTISPECIES: SigE family RNA polymerase sigma factor [unclassified Parafrankia]|uniref:SigE family RNA polymerase sigma factor n=1 Tax=unclassified Parafrankia TaxID=2994368 RepID=UPI000DA4B476|nr:MULTISPECIES: SigE family RNA polymerase sigma factor [unclassified Parafrankia]SQE00124.1 RNA polymerase, sigma-24 subunit, ECF subfamily [Parafrankia sp. Ea1.12]